MLKKIIIYSGIFFSLFILKFDLVSAVQVCEYEANIEDETTKLKFEIDGFDIINCSYNAKDGKCGGDYVKVEKEYQCPKIIYAKRNPGLGSYIHLYKESTSETKFELMNFSKVNCGNITEIPKKLPELTSYCFTIMQVAVPVILIIIGSIDLVKGLYAQKEDEIKKGQRVFLKRLIVAILIFFIVVIVKLIISVVAESSSQNMVECIDCFLNGVENCS